MNNTVILKFAVCQISLISPMIKKSDKSPPMMNGDEGGQLSDFIGRDTVLMRGDIRLIGGIPQSPPTRENPVFWIQLIFWYCFSSYKCCSASLTYFNLTNNWFQKLDHVNRPFKIWFYSCVTFTCSRFNKDYWVLVHCKKYQVTLTKIPYRIIFRIFCALVHQRKLWDNLWSRGYTSDIFTRTGNTTLLCDVAGAVKLGCCTCDEGQLLQQNCWDNVAEYLSNWTFCNILQILGQLATRATTFTEQDWGCQVAIASRKLQV